ncbi:SDR family NAD(P)-dependent oxidoreductase [Flavilitoribacter nigricans]|uniref:Oxidoreductase n=1 Tax=Flavilitoribacter nigricans (strain ATCC 23147 / DSM 23189 / NBRC 102662 / NCIMB 1420 / SS-2) TaxID=1122177 RepID=A0A2D0N904_FLAN2|nr:SDR family oxidoreductase [Flavilitoribacter nigricans]PHN04967.1 oxidoreductase [Flavilitoribacter nigricans DSM 23189 = NBRC 102662]
MEDKNYLVVGGSSGIGLALVEQLQAGGASVWVWSRTGDALQQMDRVHHQAVDVEGDEFPVSDLPDQLDGVAYCPGTINLKPFRSLDPAQFQTDWHINVLGAVKVLQAVEKKLKKAGTASVVLFSTVAVGRGMPFHASVAAAKGAIEGLGRSLAAEWAPRIRVNIVAPSLTDTPLAERLLSSEERKKSAAERHPLKRYAQPQEIAKLALYLLGPDSQWITGQVMGIDGGLSTI